MSNKIPHLVENSFRSLYGKLFSALVDQFGIQYIGEIEDALQNTFLKSIRLWQKDAPRKLENWLYVVTKNDVRNQIKRYPKTSLDPVETEQTTEETENTDLRLQTILFFCSSKTVSRQTLVIFMLKNIFGLHVKEISESTLTQKEAIYKSLKRATKSFQSEFKEKHMDMDHPNVNDREIHIVEEILYAVFSLGFDSFDERLNNIVNEDLCMEALALAKLLLNNYNQVSTRNLLALFCFHLARIPAKVQNGQLIPFFEQDRSLWNEQLINLGFHYLEKPANLNRIYLEALIVSKHMTSRSFDQNHWEEIIQLYKMMMKVDDSPVVKINYAYCLYHSGKNEQATNLLEQLENHLPGDHFYLSVVKAKLIQETDPEKSARIIGGLINSMNQKVRKEFLKQFELSSFRLRDFG